MKFVCILFIAIFCVVVVQAPRPPKAASPAKSTLSKETLDKLIEKQEQLSDEEIEKLLEPYPTSSEQKNKDAARLVDDQILEIRMYQFRAPIDSDAGFLLKIYARLLHRVNFAEAEYLINLAAYVVQHPVINEEFAKDVHTTIKAIVKSYTVEGKTLTEQDLRSITNVLETLNSKLVAHIFPSRAPNGTTIRDVLGEYGSYWHSIVNDAVMLVMKALDANAPEVFEKGVDGIVVRALLELEALLSEIQDVDTLKPSYTRITVYLGKHEEQAKKMKGISEKAIGALMEFLDSNEVKNRDKASANVRQKEKIARKFQRSVTNVSRKFCGVPSEKYKSKDIELKLKDMWNWVKTVAVSHEIVNEIMEFMSSAFCKICRLDLY